MAERWGPMVPSSDALVASRKQAFLIDPKFHGGCNSCAKLTFLGLECGR